MNYDDDDDDDARRPRPKKRPKPNGMSTGGIVLIVCAVAFVIAGLVGGGVWFVWKKGRQRATDEQLQAEREADRLEAAAAFANPVPPSPEESAEFRQFFDALGAALDRGDARFANSVFDIDRLADELTRTGALDNLPGGGRGGDFRRGMKQGAGAGLGQGLVNNQLLRWEQTQIRRIRWSADHKEAVVIAVHRQKLGDENVRMKVRWWMIRRGDGWKAYDLEDLDIGMRFTMLMKTLLAGGNLADLVNGAQAMRESAQTIQQAMLAIAKDKDAEEADRLMTTVRGRKVPDFLAALREMIEGMIALQKGEPAQALERFQDSERLLPASPLMRLMKSAALNHLQRWDEALAAARSYMDELGPDAIACGNAGVALEGLARPQEALDMYRSGLDDDPDEIECLKGLVRTLPVENKNEVVNRIDKTAKPMQTFEALLAEARQEGDDAAVAAVIAWLRKTKPNDVRVRTEELKQLVKTKKFADAAARLKKELATGTSDDHRELLDAYIEAMMDADEFVRAYESMPEDRLGATFRRLAEELEDQLDEDEDGKPGRAAKLLGELIAAHRTRDPGDPWLNVYEGAILMQKGDHAKAEAVFADGVKKYPGRYEDPKKDGIAERLRSDRVRCFIAMKQPMKAYTEVGATRETFRQIALHFDDSNDPNGLAALIAAHRKAFPGDKALMFWEADLHYLNARYEQAARAFRQFHTVQLAGKVGKSGDDFTIEAYRTADRCVRSWVRANKPVEARAALLAFGGEKAAVNLRADVEALAGNVQALERILAEHAKNEGGPWIFYSDEDFVRLTAGPEFAALRAKYPDPRPKPMGKAG